MAIDLERIRTLADEVVGAAGCELVEVELKGSGRQRTLRVFIDQESGISHEDCERVSRELSVLLDVEDLVPSAYTLEISSPGLDRKLTRPEDFVRFSGRRVRVRTHSPVGKQKVFHGQLEGIDQGRICMLSDSGDRVEIAMEVVRDARLEVDWKSELHAARSR